jgi:hypothetical protein
MRRGLLARHFEGVAVKRLSAVEADTRRSNQHEFNGIDQLKQVFGPGRQTLKTRFIWLEDEQEAVSEDGFLTWYDAREKHPVRSEYRMYFPTTTVSILASEGDTLFVAKRTNGTAMVVVTPAGSTTQRQLLWLFDLPDQPGLQFTAEKVTEGDLKLNLAVRHIMDELEVEVEEPEADLLDELLKKFGAKFPSMKEFSAFARSTVKDVSPNDDMDAALVAWMEREEILFRRLERHLVADRLREGFMSGDDPDIDGFLDFSLSVQNRRKMRAGSALELHLATIFEAHGIRFGRGCETEDKNKPDFLFPGCVQYQDVNFPEARLTMLGAKSTLKERWRQVLAEAARIKEKHLLTLSPSISQNQTNQMRGFKLQLVVPKPLHTTYNEEQRKWLLSLADFVSLVSKRQ